MDSELPPDVIAALEANRKIDAIKLLRQHRNIGLKEAKGTIDTYLAENPPLNSDRSKQEGSGIGRLLLIGIIAALVYGLYDYFLATS